MAALERHIESLVDQEDIPLAVAIADPDSIVVGVSIQAGYPLTSIEREYGVPFARLRYDPNRLISDPGELHSYKWSIDVHENVFLVDATNDLRTRTTRHADFEQHVDLLLSTGIGNLLQNRRSIGYVNKVPYMVQGELPDEPPPYACLVQYLPGGSEAEAKTTGTVGIELLMLDQVGGCRKVDKNSYMQTGCEIQALDDSYKHAGFENRIRWAVSGYPLVLCGQPVPLEMTADNVTDFRHLWRLPRLSNSLEGYLCAASRLPELRKKRIEFYFGIDALRARGRAFVDAVVGGPVSLSVDLPVTDRWRMNVSRVCDISHERFLALDIYEAGSGRLALEPDAVKADFESVGYKSQLTSDDVVAPGHFHIDPVKRTLVLWPLPGIYPHHIVGITSGGRLVDVVIAGRSGRSGITIEHAKEFCREAGLVDALVLDNGFDVFARPRGGNVICHAQNTRQKRLTGSLHYGYLSALRTDGSAPYGWQFAEGTIQRSPGLA